MTAYTTVQFVSMAMPKKNKSIKVFGYWRTFVLVLWILITFFDQNLDALSAHNMLDMSKTRCDLLEFSFHISRKTNEKLAT